MTVILSYILLYMYVCMYMCMYITSTATTTTVIHTNGDIVVHFCRNNLTNSRKCGKTWRSNTPLVSNVCMYVSYCMVLYCSV